MLTLLVTHSLVLAHAHRTIVFERKTGQALKCYVVDRDVIRYGERLGTDPQTGRPCLPVTAEIVERIDAYNKGARPQRIIAGDGPFFDALTGNPLAWFYQNDNGDVELYNLIGFHPRTGEELRPVTRAIVTEWQKLVSRRVPQTIRDPEKHGWFDPLTGARRIWYHRAEEGLFDFYDGPGFHPGTGTELMVVSNAIIDDWRRQAVQPPKSCFIVTRDPREPVRYGITAGVDPETGRTCRELTPTLIERVREYATGKLPRRVPGETPMFYDPRTGEPTVWYSKLQTGEIELFDLMGFHPTTGEELLPVTQDVVAFWKQQISRRIPQRIEEPDKYGWFDPANGTARIWYHGAESAQYEFYDGPGFHPQTGIPLVLVSREVIVAWHKSREEHDQRHASCTPRRVVPKQETEIFDPKTGAPLLWFWRKAEGEYEFFDCQGFHPQNGEPLKHLTREEARAYHGELAARQGQAEKERARRAEQARKLKEEDERAAREAQRQEEERAQRHREEMERRSRAAALCDQLAANPNDPRKVGDGVSFFVLKEQAAAAVENCRAAVQQKPSELRFKYQLGRALQWVDRPQAFVIHQELARQGYPAAFDNLGWLYYLDKRDPGRAVSLFRAGVQLNDADSMLSLAEMIDRNHAIASNPAESKIELYRRACHLGHGRGCEVYELETAKRQQEQQQQSHQLQQQQMMLRIFGTVLQNMPRR